MAKMTVGAFIHADQDPDVVFKADTRVNSATRTEYIAVAIGHDVTIFLTPDQAAALCAALEPHANTYEARYPSWVAERVSLVKS